MKSFSNFIGKIIKLITYFQTKRKIKEKAKADFVTARGRQHLFLLKKFYPLIKKDLKKELRKVKKIESKIKNILNEREKKLIKRASEILVQNISEIKGIGPILKERIIKTCFRRSIKDLRNASYFIRGIGPEKQLLINEWIEKQLPLLYEMVAGKIDFPGKSEIIKKYEKEILIFQKQLNIVRKKLKENEFLKNKIENEIKKLKEVKLKHFIQIYFQNNPFLTKKVEDYLIGVFPEWEPIPKWFQKIIKKYAGK